MLGYLGAYHPPSGPRPPAQAVAPLRLQLRLPLPPHPAHLCWGRHLVCKQWISLRFLRFPHIDSCRHSAAIDCGPSGNPIILSTTRQQWEERWSQLKSASGYFIIVVEDIALEKVVGAATLLVERKFIHQCGQVSVTYFSQSRSCPVVENGFMWLPILFSSDKRP